MSLRSFIHAKPSFIEAIGASDANPGIRDVIAAAAVADLLYRHLSDAAVRPPGFLGISLFGILLICVGLSDELNANSNFNQQIIVHGYANRANRPMPAALHSATRFALVVDMIGAGLVAVGVCGFFYFN